MAAGGRAITPAFVQRPEGFSGSAGTVRFGADNLMQHPLAIYEVTPQGPRELQGPDRPAF